MALEAKLSQVIEREGRTTAIVRFYRLLDDDPVERELISEMQLAFGRLLTREELMEEINRAMAQMLR
jgi:hypothetical protein